MLTGLDGVDADVAYAALLDLGVTWIEASHMIHSHGLVRSPERHTAAANAVHDHVYPSTPSPMPPPPPVLQQPSDGSHSQRPEYPKRGLLSSDSSSSSSTTSRTSSSSSSTHINKSSAHQQRSVHELINETVDTLVSPYRTANTNHHEGLPCVQSECRRDSGVAVSKEETFYDASRLNKWIQRQPRLTTECPRFAARHPRQPSASAARRRDEEMDGATVGGAIISADVTLRNGDPSLIRALIAQRTRGSPQKRREAHARSRSHVAGGPKYRSDSLAPTCVALDRVSTLPRRDRSDPVALARHYETLWGAAPLRLEKEDTWSSRRSRAWGAFEARVTPFSDVYSTSGSGKRKEEEWAWRYRREHRRAVPFVESW